MHSESLCVFTWICVTPSLCQRTKCHNFDVCNRSTNVSFHGRARRLFRRRSRRFHHINVLLSSHLMIKMIIINNFHANVANAFHCQAYLVLIVLFLPALSSFLPSCTHRRITKNNVDLNFSIAPTACCHNVNSFSVISVDAPWLCACSTTKACTTYVVAKVSVCGLICRLREH